MDDINALSGTVGSSTLNLDATRLTGEIADARIPASIARDSEIPTTLPNPNALTFTGESTATYDGSAAVTVNLSDMGATSLEDLDDVSITATDDHFTQAAASVTNLMGDGDYIVASRVLELIFPSASDRTPYVLNNTVCLLYTSDAADEG